jgi:hypothetical protein
MPRITCYTFVHSLDYTAQYGQVSGEQSVSMRIPSHEGYAKVPIAAWSDSQGSISLATFAQAAMGCETIWSLNLGSIDGHSRSQAGGAFAMSIQQLDFKISREVQSILPIRGIRTLPATIEYTANWKC